MIWFNFSTIKMQLAFDVASQSFAYEPNSLSVWNERHVPPREFSGKHNYFHSLTSFFSKYPCNQITH
jgi:hypothetical protein